MDSQRWTDFQTSKARELLAQGVGEREFRLAIGRSRAAAFARIKYLDDPVFRERCIQNATRNRKKYEAREPTDPSYLYVEPKPVIPEQLLLDARERLLAARSITAMLCGDPAPGFSALDRRG